MLFAVLAGRPRSPSRRRDLQTCGIGRPSFLQQTRQFAHHLSSSARRRPGAARSASSSADSPFDQVAVRSPRGRRHRASWLLMSRNSALTCAGAANRRSIRVAPGPRGLFDLAFQDRRAVRPGGLQGPTRSSSWALARAFPRQAAAAKASISASPGPSGAGAVICGAMQPVQPGADPVQPGAIRPFQFDSYALSPSFVDPCHLPRLAFKIGPVSCPGPARISAPISVFFGVEPKPCPVSCGQTATNSMEHQAFWSARLSCPRPAKDRGRTASLENEDLP